MTTTFSAFASQSRTFLSNRKTMLLVFPAPISIHLTARRVFLTPMIAIQCPRPMWATFSCPAATKTIRSTLACWTNLHPHYPRRPSTTLHQATSTHRTAARTFPPLLIHRYKVIGRLPFCRPIRQCPRCPPAKCIIRRPLPRKLLPLDWIRQCPLNGQVHTSKLSYKAPNRRHETHTRNHNHKQTVLKSFLLNAVILLLWTQSARLFLYWLFL